MRNTEYAGPITSISEEIDAMKYRQEGESFDDKVKRMAGALNDNPEHQLELEDINNNQSFVSVNTQSVSDEEVKYTLKDGYVQHLSKEVKNGLGEAVGINFISSNDLDVFINQLETCDDNDYFEKGLEMAIANDHLKLKVIDISKYNCIEVDFKEDLKNANEIV